MFVWFKTVSLSPLAIAGRLAFHQTSTLQTLLKPWQGDNTSAQHPLTTIDQIQCFAILAFVIMPLCSDQKWEHFIIHNRISLPRLWRPRDESVLNNHITRHKERSAGMGLIYFIDFLFCYFVLEAHCSLLVGSEVLLRGWTGHCHVTVCTLAGMCAYAEYDLEVSWRLYLFRDGDWLLQTPWSCLDYDVEVSWRLYLFRDV